MGYLQDQMAADARGSASREGERVAHRSDPAHHRTPAPGDHFGINAAALAAYSPLVDTYDQEINKPGTARRQRKTEGEELRPRYAAADADLDEVDDFIEDLRGVDDAHRMFVETYFNLRELGAGGSDGSSGLDKGDGGKPVAPVKPPAS